MSKYQESLDNLHDYVTEKLREEDLSVNHFIIEFNSLQQLIDIYPEYLELKAKATPKKVVNWLRDKSMACCPYCSSAGYSEENPKYCYYCGQAIDWSEENA